MNEFLNDFLNEVNELLNKLESDLFELEKQPGNDSLIQEVFRGMHSIKGASGMYGYDKTGTLTHYLEDIFDDIRSKNTSLDTPLVNITLRAIDILRCLIKTEEKGCLENYNELLEELSKMTLDSEPKIAVKEAETQSGSSLSLYYLLFTPDEGIYYRGINPLNVLEEVAELGTYTENVHDGGVPLEKQNEEKQCRAKWELYLATNKAIQELEDIFIFFNKEEFYIGELSPGVDEFPQGYFSDIEHAGLQGIHEPQEKINDFFFKELEKVEQQVQEESQVNNKEAEPNNGQQEEPLASSTKLEKGIFVSSEKLDEMVNLVSELVTTNARLETICEKVKHDDLLEVSEKIHRLSKQFRDNALSIRLVPIKILYQQFQRLVRELSIQLGKEVEFIAEGLDTELDKTIIKALESPLMHIIRNSIDHGIELPETRLRNNKAAKGLLRLMSYYSGSHVVIQIQDDGAGIDLERVREAAIKKGTLLNSEKVSEKELLELILHPGFSTTKNVSMVSGRGVGMDVVNQQVASVRGSLEINTEKGLGTIITLNIPVTLSIIDTLVITVDQYYFLIPVSDILKCVAISNHVINTNVMKQIDFENEKIPFIDLRSLFAFGTEIPAEHKSVIISKNNQRFALLCDRIIGDHQAVLKPLGRMFIDKEFLSGASILGNGCLAYILDTSNLLMFTQKKYNLSSIE